MWYQRRLPGREEGAVDVPRVAAYHRLNRRYDELIDMPEVTRPWT